MLAPALSPRLRREWETDGGGVVPARGRFPLPWREGDRGRG
ncbi:hypothetical protein JCM30394_03310 [Deferrisoma palaeochoriense]